MREIPEGFWCLRPTNLVVDETDAAVVGIDGASDYGVPITILRRLNRRFQLGRSHLGASRGSEYGWLSRSENILNGRQNALGEQPGCRPIYYISGRKMDGFLLRCRAVELSERLNFTDLLP
jgi:hypothetical protein